MNITNICSMSETEQLSFRIESSIMAEIDQVTKDEFLDNNTQTLRKAIRFYLEYRKIPKFELDKLNEKYNR